MRSLLRAGVILAISVGLVGASATALASPEREPGPPGIVATAEPRPPDGAGPPTETPKPKDGKSPRAERQPKETKADKAPDDDDQSETEADDADTLEDEEASDDATDGARPEKGGAHSDHGRPEGAGKSGPRGATEHGAGTSPSAHEKVEGVSNPAGRTVKMSLVAFCRSQAPWMESKGSACDVLAAFFSEQSAAGEDRTSEGAGDTRHGPPGHTERRAAAEAARATAEVARGLLARVASLLG